MNRLKKLSLVLLASTALTTTTMASDAYKYLSIGANSATVANEDATGYAIGWGLNKYYDSGLFFGIGFEITAISLEAETVTGYGTDLRIGYTEAIQNHAAALYGIVSAQGQDIANGSAYGFGYGAGVSYRITEWLETDLEYKTYSMTHESSIEYDSDTIALNLKFTY